MEVINGESAKAIILLHSYLILVANTSVGPSGRDSISMDGLRTDVAEPKSRKYNERTHTSLILMISENTRHSISSSGTDDCARGKDIKAFQ